MMSRKLRSRVVISGSTAPLNNSCVKLKRIHISHWLGSRSAKNCEENSSDSDRSIQSCSRSSSSNLLSNEATSTPPRKGSNSTQSTREDGSTVVLQLEEILTCNVPDCNYHTSFKKDLERHKKIKHELKRLKCHDCDYVTHSKYAFNRHTSTHQSKVSFKCQRCPWTSAIRALFVQNMKQTHERANRREQGVSRASEFGKRFKCSKCDFRAVAKQEIHLHNYSHETERKYKCSFPGCDYRAKAASSLREHVKRHDVEAKKEFQCPLCSRLFWTKSTLHHHIQYHTKEWTVKCSKCKYVASNGSKLRAHMHSHAKESDDGTDEQNCGETLKRGVLNDEQFVQTPEIENPTANSEPNREVNILEREAIKTALEPAVRASPKIAKKPRNSLQEPASIRKKTKTTPKKNFKCDQCDFTAINQMKITRHAVVHRDPNDKLYSCSFAGCNFKTNREDYLERHYKNLHKSTPDHVCPVEGCRFQTKWNDALARHTKIHEKKRKKIHQCPMCRKAFYDSCQLKRHINIHTREQIYKCLLCDYVSVENCNFNAHRRKYHAGQECEPIKI